MQSLSAVVVAPSCLHKSSQAADPPILQRWRVKGQWMCSQTGDAEGRWGLRNTPLVVVTEITERARIRPLPFFKVNRLVRRAHTQMSGRHLQACGPWGKGQARHAWGRKLLGRPPLVLEKAASQRSPLAEQGRGLGWSGGGGQVKLKKKGFFC